VIAWLLAVVSDFAESWPLLWHGWIAGWLIAVTLALPGVLVVAREQIFIGAAVAQGSTFGVAAGMWLVAILGQADAHGHPDSGSAIPAACAALTGTAAALAISAGRRTGRGSPESRTGWIWLASSAGTVLLLSSSPHGAHGIERLIASSLLGAGTGDAWLFAVLASATLTLALALRRPLTVLAIDPALAPLVGIDRRWWEPAIAIWLGLCIGLAIRVSGLLFTFGCLVLPALAARGLCREVRSQFLVAPALALVAGVAGFAVANHHDLPPAQVAVGMLCAIPLLTGAIGWVRGIAGRRPTLGCRP